MHYQDVANQNIMVIQVTTTTVNYSQKSILMLIDIKVVTGIVVVTGIMVVTGMVVTVVVPDHNQLVNANKNSF